jgi:hypothetical protein
LRTLLAILAACVAFTVALAALFPVEEIFTEAQDEASDQIYMAVLLTSVLGVLALLWCLIASGILVAPTTGLRSHILERIRGNAAPASGGWVQAALVGLVACLIAAFVSAAIRTWSPDSFTEETCWRDFGFEDAVELAAAHFAGGIVVWLGILNLVLWGCLRAFGARRRTHAMAAAIVLTELLCFGLVAALTTLLVEPISLAIYAEAAAWSILSVIGAWLYATRTLEHGLLAMMWAPVVIVALRPLWAHLGI